MPKIIETYELPTKPGTYRYKKRPNSEWSLVVILDGGSNWGLYINDMHSSSVETLRGVIWGGEVQTVAQAQDDTLKLAQAVLSWWDEAKCMVNGDRNVFDDEPEMVSLAKETVEKLS